MISACHLIGTSAGDLGSTPSRGDSFFFLFLFLLLLFFYYRSRTTLFLGHSEALKGPSTLVHELLWKCLSPSAPASEYVKNIQPYHQRQDMRSDKHRPCVTLVI